jgi:ATP-dependent RNA helicase DDX27
VTKKEKIKLSNKDKKRLDDSKMRHEGDVGRKKSKAERDAPKTNGKGNKDKGKGKGQGKGKGKGKGRK